MSDTDFMSDVEWPELYSWFRSGGDLRRYIRPQIRDFASKVEPLLSPRQAALYSSTVVRGVPAVQCDEEHGMYKGFTARVIRKITDALSSDEFDVVASMFDSLHNGDGMIAKVRFVWRCSIRETAEQCRCSISKAMSVDEAVQDALLDQISQMRRESDRAANAE